jgi:hypothetical protein
MFLRGDLSVRKPSFFFDHFVLFSIFKIVLLKMEKLSKNVKIQENEKQTIETGFLERSFSLKLFPDLLRLETGE